MYRIKAYYNEMICALKQHLHYYMCVSMDLVLKGSHVQIFTELYKQITN